MTAVEECRFEVLSTSQPDARWIPRRAFLRPLCHCGSPLRSAPSARLDDGECPPNMRKAAVPGLGRRL